MWFRSKERGTRVKDRAKNGTSKRAERGWGRKEGNSVSFLPLPLPPLSFFGSHFISRAAKTGLSLLRNQLETLATQARLLQTSKFHHQVHQASVESKILRICTICDWLFFLTVLPWEFIYVIKTSQRYILKTIYSSDFNIH